MYLTQHLLNVEFWAPSTGKTSVNWSCTQQRTIKIVVGWSTCPVCSGFGSWVVQNGAEATSGGPTSASQHLQGGHWEDRAQSLVVTHGRRTRGNRYKLKGKKFGLGTRKKNHPQDSQAVEQGPRVFGQWHPWGFLWLELVKPWAALSDLTAELNKDKEVDSAGLSVPESGHWCKREMQFMSHFLYKNISSTFRGGRKKKFSKASIDSFPTFTVN